MKRISNLIYFLIATVGFVLTWTFNEIQWIFPLTVVALIIWLISEYIINQRRFEKQTWIGFGKKTVFYKNLILYSIFGGIWIFLSFLPGHNDTDFLFGLDIKFYMGCFFIVLGFVDVWTYPVILKKKSISFRYVDLNFERIWLSNIVDHSNEEEEFVIKTNKKTIKILKVDIPIERNEFERIATKIEEYTRHNKK